MAEYTRNWETGLYIKLYRDEFPMQVWEEYCDLLHLSSYSTVIDVLVADARTTEDDWRQFEEDEEEEEEEED